MAKWIAALRDPDQRMAWVALVADDLCGRMPGLSFAMAAAPLLERLKAMEVAQ